MRAWTPNPATDMDDNETAELSTPMMRPGAGQGEGPMASGSGGSELLQGPSATAPFGRAASEGSESIATVYSWAEWLDVALGGSTRSGSREPSPAKELLLVTRDGPRIDSLLGLGMPEAGQVAVNEDGTPSARPNHHPLSSHSYYPTPLALPHPSPLHPQPFETTQTSEADLMSHILRSAESWARSSQPQQQQQPIITLQPLQLQPQPQPYQLPAFQYPQFIPIQRPQPFILDPTLTRFLRPQHIAHGVQIDPPQHPGFHDPAPRSAFDPASFAGQGRVQAELIEPRTVFDQKGERKRPVYWSDGRQVPGTRVVKTEPREPVDSEDGHSTESDSSSESSSEPVVKRRRMPVRRGNRSRGVSVKYEEVSKTGAGVPPPREEGEGFECSMEGCGEEFETWNRYRGLLSLRICFSFA